ncbi:ATP-binding protein [Streptomyces sp. NPDC059985]|uniref:ATP-binding protein n=1 Tax=Streptomyces sp. NPDC059985 TaxID=3347025 RepID=UPI0036804A7C
MLTPVGRPADPAPPPCGAPPAPAPDRGPFEPSGSHLLVASTGGFVHWVTDPVAATVPRVRARVRAVLGEWRVSRGVAEALLLAVSELVGNVVQHAATGRMRVGVSRGGGWLRLEVADQGVGLPRLPSPRAEVDLESESGRGLLMVQLMAAELGGELSLAVDELGKSVRVRIPVA